jgi:hypothetical protein
LTELPLQGPGAVLSGLAPNAQTLRAAPAASATEPEHGSVFHSNLFVLGGGLKVNYKVVLILGKWKHTRKIEARMIVAGALTGYQSTEIPQTK